VEELNGVDQTSLLSRGELEMILVFVADLMAVYGGAPTTMNMSVMIVMTV